MRCPATAPLSLCNNLGSSCFWLTTDDQGLTTAFMEEREFFDEKPDRKSANLNCPHCHQSAEYEINWLVRTKKRSLPPRADDRDRARFAKARSYMLRKDDVMMCKNLRCRKRFDITSVQSVAFLD
jgi:hypothetical protein